MDFRTETVEGLAQRVRDKEVSARELTQAALDRIDLLNTRFNAFVAVDPIGALEQADAVDERLAAGEDVGPLAGIPLGVKDLEDAAGFVTTHGSPAHADDAPAPADSVLVARLRAAGCIVIGKTNTPEYGWKGDTENQVFGATLNPWGEGRSPGGSSGGSSAALAAGLVPLATGSDGGGSIRIPSAATGLSGHKPSTGRVPGGGSEPANWWDLSVKGPMARRIRDVAYVLDEVVAPEQTDLRSLPRPESSWRRALDDAHAPRRVGWTPNLGYGDVDDEVKEVCAKAVGVLAGLGTEVEEVDGPWDEDPVNQWLMLTSTYNLRTLERFRDTEVWERMDPQLVGLMDWSRDHVLAVDFIRALDAAHYMNLALLETFGEHDFLLAPVCAGQTPASGGMGTINGREEANWVQFTYGFNMTRSPAGTVCAGFTSDGMPVGLQVIGPQHADAAVLRLVALLEDALDLDPLAPID